MFAVQLVLVQTGDQEVSLELSEGLDGDCEIRRDV